MWNREQNDAALIAADAVVRAEKRVLFLAELEVNNEIEDGETLAEQDWKRAEGEFADAVPSTPEGVNCKLLAVIDALSAIPLSEASMEVRHLRAIMTYITQVAAAWGLRQRPVGVRPVSTRGALT